MRRFLKVVAAATTLLVTALNAATAATYFVNMNLAGFQQSGVGGIFGNGTVFASAVYSFLPGDTVDFGTAIVSADGPDGRSGPCPPNCSGNAAFGIYFLNNGAGGFVPGSFEIFDADIFRFDFVDCSTSCQIAYRLLFTLGPATDGIQLAFQGSGVFVIPPVETPLPGTLSLFAAGIAGMLVFFHLRGRRQDSCGSKVSIRRRCDWKSLGQRIRARQALELVGRHGYL